MSMDVNLNVHITVDGNFTNALSDIAGCLAAVSMAQAGKTDVRLPEKTVKPPTAPAKPVEKVKATKDTKTEEKELTGEPVTRQKAKEINDLVDAPEPKKEEPKKEEAKPDGGDREKELREQIKKAFVKAVQAKKHAECKALLTKIGVKKQSEIPADKLEEVLKEVEAL